jgi:GNAT superfamily N-acetyltransferase
MITVRQAVLADLDAIVPLFDGYRQFYGRASDLQGAREFLRARFEHGESVIFLAFDGGEAVGFTQLYPSFSSQWMARAYVLNDLFVAPQGRRKGVGTQLLSAATRFARELGAVRVSLATAVTNHTAQAVYEAAGWKRDEQFLVYHFAL